MFRRLGLRLWNTYSRCEKSLYTNGTWSVKRLCLPDFLGIGLPQSGTTWLYENLRCHPHLNLPSTKELHYFDRQFHRSLRFYSSQFDLCSDRIHGEITPGYSRLIPERIQFIRKIIPNVRLILLVRNPIQQQWSTARRILSRIPNKQLHDIDEAQFYAIFRGQVGPEGDYIRGHHAKQVVNLLDNWLSIFPREQLYIGYFDDIVKSPKTLLREIFSHIGVSGDVDWNAFPYGEAANKNPDFPLPESFREFLEDMHRNDINILCERFGAPTQWRTNKS